jgi:cAMP phosphodiesterase
MQIELLPSSIPASDLQFLVSFVVNDSVAVDAGAIGLLADLQRQQAIRHVFITHEHLDHIASLPIFLENVYAAGPECVEVLASADVLEFLHGDVFNGRVWPDFFELSRPDNAFLRTTPLEPLVPVVRAGLTITPIPVSHGVETLGLVVDDGTSAVAFPSDTGATEHLWRHLAGVPHLKAVFLETSFPSSHSELAALTGHLCPRTFEREVAKLPEGVRKIVVHRKARFAAQIARELDELGLHDVELVQPGKHYRF